MYFRRTTFFELAVYENPPKQNGLRRHWDVSGALMHKILKNSVSYYCSLYNSQYGSQDVQRDKRMPRLQNKKTFAVFSTSELRNHSQLNFNLISAFLILPLPRPLTNRKTKVYHMVNNTSFQPAKLIANHKNTLQSSITLHKDRIVGNAALINQPTTVA